MFSKLQYFIKVPLLAEEIKVYPNIRPDKPKLLGIEIPGEKKYLVGCVLIRLSLILAFVLAR